MPVRLRVAASTTIGTYALPPVLARLARSHPLVRVDLQIANTQKWAKPCWPWRSTWA
jgi:DNA-binding transcriptional LysR family regulator